MDEQKNQIDRLRRYVAAAEESLAAAKQALAEIDSTSPLATKESQGFNKNAKVTNGGKIIEGTFDGENMIGPEDKIYPVPANYASKSKLVQGDRLKLTVAEDGSFIFKQIGPVERKKIVGTLNFEDNAYHVLAEGKSYNILHASVTYYKAKPGDKVTIVVPRDVESNWATLENIIHDVKEEPMAEPEETGLLEESAPEKDPLTSIEIPTEPTAPAEPAVEPTQAASQPNESQVFEVKVEDPKEAEPGAAMVTEVSEANQPSPEPAQVFAAPTEPQSPVIKSETTEQAVESSEPTPMEAGGSVMPEESFLPRTTDDESNSLGEKTASAWDTAAQPVNPISELDI